MRRKIERRSLLPGDDDSNAPSNREDILTDDHERQDLRDPEHDFDPRDVIPPEDPCPECGEQDPNLLSMLDDRRARCETCGTIY
jgi:hypothetical protein